MYIVACVIYDNQRGVQSIQWFRGCSIEKALERRDDYMLKHPHSEILREDRLSPEE